MRIGIDARFYNESGVGRYIRNLIDGLSKIKTEHTFVVFLSENAYNSVSFQKKNFEKILVNIPWHSVQEQIAFPKVLNDAKLDLMHFPYFSVPLRYKKPYVITIHDLILHHFPTGKASTKALPIYITKLIAYKYIMQQAANNAQKIIAVSHATKQQIVTDLHTDPDMIVVSYEGVEDFFFASRSEKRLVPDPYFLHVGNVYPHKNMERLIEAFSQVILQTKKPIKLILAGKRDFFLKRLEDVIAKHGVTQSVFILDDIDDTKLKMLYDNAQALVIPSLMEGFGLPAVEAMAAHCLVIASDILALKEICGDSAVYFDPYDVSDMKNALMKVLDNKQGYKKHIAEGLIRAKEFSWNTMAAECLQIYESSARL